MSVNASAARNVLALAVSLGLLATACGDDSGPPSQETAAPFYGGHESDIYADDAHWLCKPDIADDVCDRDLTATVVHADGTTEIEEHQPTDDAAVDCFYIYPTVTMDESGNSDLDPTEDEEIGAVLSQAARLSSVCDIYAPVYRQVTVDAIGGTGDWELAYGDVLDAFRHYVDNASEGRDFVLVGHSQGASHLRRLVREEIDDEPELLDRLVGAHLIGWTMNVPEGETVGGDFANLGACEAVDQTGCLVAYSAYHDDQLPPAGDNPAYGEPRDATFDGAAQALCVNPAEPGGRGFTTPYFRVDPEGSGLFSDAGLEPFGEGSDEELTTPYVTFPDLIEVECRYETDLPYLEAGFSYLEVTVHTDPTDGRLDDIGGHFVLEGDPDLPHTGDWGLHLLDYQLAMGDIVSMVAAQAAS